MSSDVVVFPADLRPMLLRLVGACAALALAAGFAPAHAALIVLHDFQGGRDGAYPYAGLVFDSQGALYGTTAFGGASNVGTVFKLAPPAPGQTRWTYSILYSFKGWPADGSQPQAGVVVDNQGALYGTTLFGGSPNKGTVFKLTPPAPGQTRWTEAILYQFTDPFENNANPYAGLVFDSHGALYGTVSSNFGSVFQLTPPATGQTKWTQTALYRFKLGDDGGRPLAGVIFDSKGALYGTTYLGSVSHRGTVFKLAPPAVGQTQWTETLLHGFEAQNDGIYPAAGVIFDSQGALYGTTAYGSVPFTRGTVFKLAPPAAGQTQWTETVLHGFKGGNDGSHPFASLILDSQGALYGTTCGGQGSTSDRSWGTVFKLMPPAAGQTQWTQTILHNFTNGRDGACPRGGVVFDGTGALYGTTGWGGAAGHGVVFKLQ